MRGSNRGGGEVVKAYDTMGGGGVSHWKMEGAGEKRKMGWHGWVCMDSSH